MQPAVNVRAEADPAEGRAAKAPKDIKKRFEDLQVSMRRETRRNLLDNRRFANPLAATQGDARCDFSFDHLAQMPNRDMLIAKISEWNAQPTHPELLYQFFEDIASSDVMQQHAGIIGLRKILSQKQGLPIQQVIDHNVVVKILAMAQNSAQPHLQMEATWCLANMASGTTEQTASLIQKNVIPVFVELTRSPFYQIAEQAIWGLGNISGDCVEFRSAVMKSPAVEVLLEVYDNAASMKVQDQIVWVFANICRLRPDQEPIHATLKRIIAKLIEVFTRSTNAEVQDDALFGICKSTKATAIDLFANPDFLARLYDFEQACLADLQTHKHRISAINAILGGLTSSSNVNTLMVVRSGFLAPFSLLLGCGDESLVRETCWVLSNIAIGEEEQVRALLMEPGLFPQVVTLTHSASADLAKEAIWLICNLCLCKNADNIRFLIDQGGILDIFKECLDVHADSRRITLVFEALIQLINFFEAGRPAGSENPFVRTLIQTGIAERIELLQTHRSEVIYIKALSILETHFALDEDWVPAN